MAESTLLKSCLLPECVFIPCLVIQEDQLVRFLLILQNVHYFANTITSLLTAPAAEKLVMDGILTLFGRFGSLIGLLSWAVLCDFLNVGDRWRCGHLFGVVLGL